MLKHLLFLKLDLSLLSAANSSGRASVLSLTLLYNA